MIVVVYRAVASTALVYLARLMAIKRRFGLNFRLFQVQTDILRVVFDSLTFSSRKHDMN